jgi:hypothetical protein
MRPRVRSYGLNSTATRSPGSMRIKFFRMRPETCAKTWCLFSSSTLNMAFGNVSRTVAITSIASSFDNPYPDSACHRQASPQIHCVRTTAPSVVTATVCSKCALKLPSSVTAVQPSLSTCTPGLPEFTMGSMQSTMPSRSFKPCPRRP